MVAPPLSALVLLSFLLVVVLRAAASSPSPSTASPNSKNGNRRSNDNDYGGRRRFCSDPYDVLRVDRHCDQDEIRRQYRRLCLRHHPDKKGGGRRGRVGRLPDEDDDFEFKEVQHAYSLVGTEEDRRKYDLAARRGIDPSSSRDDAGRGDGGRDRARRRRDDGAAHVVFRPATVYFAFGDGAGGRAFFRFSSDLRGRAPDFFGTDASARGKTRSGTVTPRPHYVQEVTVPLDVLYAGGIEVELRLRTSPFDRYRAAHRGGLLLPALLEAALAVLLTRLRSGRAIGPPLLSLALFASLVHARVPPPPRRTSYTTVVRRGWKSGTEVKYSDEEGSDVTFVLREGRHDTYARVGNNLHVEVAVSPRQLRRGCTLYVEPLVSGDGPIRLRLGPNEVGDGGTVTVRSRGWPISGGRDGGGGRYGDLHVKVRCRASLRVRDGDDFSRRRRGCLSFQSHVCF
jgi:DnaJ-class molecular chaperone